MDLFRRIQRFVQKEYEVFHDGTELDYSAVKRIPEIDREEISSLQVKLHLLKVALIAMSECLKHLVGMVLVLNLIVHFFWQSEYLLDEGGFHKVHLSVLDELLEQRNEMLEIIKGLKIRLILSSVLCTLEVVVEKLHVFAVHQLLGVDVRLTL